MRGGQDNATTCKKEAHRPRRDATTIGMRELCAITVHNARANASRCIRIFTAAVRSDRTET